MTEEEENSVEAEKGPITQQENIEMKRVEPEDRVISHL